MPSHNPQDWAIPPWTNFQSLCDTALKKAADKLADEKYAAANALTEEQFIEAMRQALACGDFMRYVHIDGSCQSVTYEPFRECQSLRNRLKFFEQQMKAIYKLVAEDEAPT